MAVETESRRSWQTSQDHGPATSNRRARHGSRTAGFRGSKPLNAKSHVPSASSITDGVSPGISKSVQACPRFFFNGHGYCSLSEAACGTLLELYVPGFTVIDGETFQVPMGNGTSVDFMVKGVLLEYHPPRFAGDRRRFGDFPTRAAYVRFMRELSKVRHNPYKRGKLLRETAEILKSSYAERRRKLVDSCPEHSGKELVIAHDMDELYEKIILRFNPHHAPIRAELHEVFAAMIKEIARQNRGYSDRRVRAA